MTSQLSGFYRLDLDDRRARVAAIAGLSPTEIDALSADAGLSDQQANRMVENVLGVLGLPLGVCVNLRVNGRDCLVPMATEEPSVVAAVSNMARLTRRSGGLDADADPSIMIGQVQLCAPSDPEGAVAALEAALPELHAVAASVHPRLVARGGGVRGLRVRRVDYDEPGFPAEAMVVVEVLLDCVDAMGANMINTVAEHLAPHVEAITGERVGLRILSNLASHRLARARCRIPAEHLASEGMSGDEVAEGIANAWRFAWADPWRAATHNKGVMNGIDAVVLATGNDWRAVEAGAHAFAARSGRYAPLSIWRRDGRTLVGRIELPLALGTVGGTLRVHPGARLALDMLGVESASDLAAAAAAVGLASNLAAVRALATDGIQRGHMALHARSVALAAGAVGAQVERVAAMIVEAREITVEGARRALTAMDLSARQPADAAE
ncbi:MAG: hydroxymethylglutaryl-CoA reductase, degradative [Myxococcales bacterium]|nr:hydroxymethylglutaryl-CoA reductase, degradative [Myxococcales bacterium]